MLKWRDWNDVTTVVYEFVHRRVEH